MGLPRVKTHGRVECTAACEDCCFECTPHLESEMLTFDFMSRVIDSAIDSLPSLRLVVFSGGECYMLNDELYRTIAYATSKGLATRTVSNGYWGKSLDKARRIARQVHDAGITEVNFSTGLDHQQWVPLASIANCVTALTDLGVTTLVTIEKDTPESNCWNLAHAHPQIRAALAAQPSRLTVICSAWMPFKQDSKPRSEDANSTGAGEGCKQIFSMGAPAFELQVARDMLSRELAAIIDATESVGIVALASGEKQRLLEQCTDAAGRALGLA